MPKDVHRAVEASRAAVDFSVSEDIGTLTVVGRFDREALHAWQAVKDALPGWLRFSCYDEHDDAVDPAQARDGDKVRVRLSYDVSPGAVHLFTTEGWRSFLLDEEQVATVSVVRLAFADTGFATRSMVVEPWTEAPVAAEMPNVSPDRSPRRQVRGHSGAFMAPRAIEPWIRDRQDADSVGLHIWSEIATDCLCRAIPSELHEDTDGRWVRLSGQPSRRLPYGTPDPNQRLALQEAAAWVYLEGLDPEVRHTFLAAELAREWPGAEFAGTLGSKVPAALESAKLLYKAHLRAGSKDTLKALADLRKALADDVQRVVQLTRDLSASVWRDTVVAIGLLGVRFGIDAAKTAASYALFSLIYILVALYVFFSYRTTLAINRDILARAEETRTTWRTKLYAFLDEDDYNALATAPMAGAAADYRKIVRRTGFIVGLVVVLLLLAAIVEAGLLDPPEQITRVIRWLGLCISAPGSVPEVH